MAEEKKYPHEGHRDRVKQRFLSVGFENMAENEILEMLLFYAIPRKDTNDLAKSLLKNFGTLYDVLTAPLEELKKCGLSENTLIYLKMADALCRKYYDEKSGNTVSEIANSSVADKLAPLFSEQGKYEKTAVILFDTYGREICASVIYEGAFADTDRYIKKLLELLLKHHAWAVILAHSHINNIPMPSAQDINTTYILKNKINAVNIKLLDHIIFTGHNSVSMASLEEFKNIFSVTE